MCDIAVGYTTHITAWQINTFNNRINREENTTENVHLQIKKTKH